MMTQPRFIQIHTLHNYPAALLNRDDAGLAKRLPYGDAVRTRISSQCLKRHWRTAEDGHSLSKLGVPMAIRSRVTLDLIRKELIAQGISDASAQVAAEGLRAGGLLDKSKELTGKDALETGQAVLLGRAEIDFLVKRCATLARDFPEDKALKTAIAAFLKEEKKNIEALKHGSGLESALFGRFVTSDILTTRDAAVYVAHAFTVHEAQVENDYFTVVDDLLRDAGEQGSAGIFDTELASGLYYGYVVVDVPQLVANLEGTKVQDWDTLPAERRELAGQVVQSLMHLIATVSPGAKRGSTAPFEWAKFMLVEAGDWQPRTLAGAFIDALPVAHSNIRRSAVERITAEVAQLDRAYGAPLERRFLTTDDLTVPGAERSTLPGLGEWVKQRITAGTVSASIGA
jgi:CRISPR system Cascade subunit CasC